MSHDHSPVAATFAAPDLAPALAESDPRHALHAVMVAMQRSGLNQGSAGNASVRAERDGQTGYWITPTGCGPDDCGPEDMVWCVLGVDAPPAASSEWRMHHDLYVARVDAQAVVHCHSPHATALACQRRPIPAFHYMVAQFGGNGVPLADYAQFGTQDLSLAMMAALNQGGIAHRACLLANHGQIVAGRSLPHALKLAQELETLAQQYLLASLGAAPVLLTDAEMAVVHERFKTYGRPVKTTPDPG